MHAAVTQTVDWTQVLVVGIPILVGQIATIVIAVMNNKKASTAAMTAKAANEKVEASAEKIDEVHRQTRPSNGSTLTQTVERMARDMNEVRREQSTLATLFGEHLGDHDTQKRRER